MIRVSFSDYMLAAIVLAMLLATSSFGHYVESNNEKDGGRLGCYKHAAACAFLGLMFCVVAAPVMESGVLPSEGAPLWDLSLVFPVSMMSSWAWFQWRASRLIAAEEIAAIYNKQLDKIILNFITKQTAPCTVDQIYSGCKGGALTNLVDGTALEPFKHSRFAARVGELADLLPELTYSYERVQKRVESLESEGLVKRENDGKYKLGESKAGFLTQIGRIGKKILPPFGNRG